MPEPWRNILWILAALSLAAPSDGLAQAPASEEARSERRWWNVWSRTSQEDRLMWFMSTLHVHHIDDGLSNDGLVGVIYRGGYAASFLTTHGPRGYTVGFERDWVSGEAGPFGGMLGFRTGLVYGYDRRLGWMAEAVPILPFAQPAFYGRVGPVTLDFTYTWVVLSLTAGLRF